MLRAMNGYSKAPKSVERLISQGSATAMKVAVVGVNPP